MKLSLFLLVSICSPQIVRATQKEIELSASFDLIQCSESSYSFSKYCRPASAELFRKLVEVGDALFSERYREGRSFLKIRSSISENGRKLFTIRVDGIGYPIRESETVVALGKAQQPEKLDLRIITSLRGDHFDEEFEAKIDSIRLVLDDSVITNQLLRKEQRLEDVRQLIATTSDLIDSYEGIRFLHKVVNEFYTRINFEVVSPINQIFSNMSLNLENTLAVLKEYAVDESETQALRSAFELLQKTDFSQFQGKTLADFLNPDDRNRIKNILSRVEEGTDLQLSLSDYRMQLQNLKNEEQTLSTSVDKLKTGIF